MRHIRSLLFSVFLFITSLGFAAEENSNKELIFITSEYCPFCGTKHEDIDEELGMDFDDHAAFGKGVEHMDEDDYNGVDE